MAKSSPTRSGASSRDEIQELRDEIERLKAICQCGPTAEDTAHYCCMPEVPVRTFDPDVSMMRQGLIAWAGKMWVNGSNLKYYFFNDAQYGGNAANVGLAREGFQIWEDVGIGISFQEVDNIEAAEVRISFLQDGRAWSYLGRDVIDIPGPNEPTMNFGWDMTQDPRGVDVAVHEIGHTLGFPHEHQNPYAGIVWDEDAVYARFAGSPNYWPAQTTYYNILRKLSTSEVQGSEWDPNSIMHYGFGPGLILQPEAYQSGLTPELGLSDVDRERARMFYPPLSPASYERLDVFDPRPLNIEPGGQKNFEIDPTVNRTYRMRTFGASDTVMVLFEEIDGEMVYVAGDDDSGTSLNAHIQQRLYRGRKYVLRVRLFHDDAQGNTLLLLW